MAGGEKTEGAMDELTFSCFARISFPPGWSKRDKSRATRSAQGTVMMRDQTSEEKGEGKGRDELDVQKATRKR